MRTEWNTFTPGVWQHEINVRDFIQKNYTPYDGDDAFLEGPTKSIPKSHFTGGNVHENRMEHIYTRCMAA